MPPEGNLENKTYNDDNFSKQDSHGLPWPIVGDLRGELGSETKNVCHAGDNGYHKTSKDQAQTNISQDGLGVRVPKGVQADKPTQADNCQANQEDGNLYESNHRAAVQTKQVRHCPEQEDYKTDQHEEQSHTDAETAI